MTNNTILSFTIGSQSLASSSQLIFGQFLGTATAYPGSNAVSGGGGGGGTALVTAGYGFVTNGEIGQDGSVDVNYNVGGNGGKLNGLSVTFGGTTIHYEKGGNGDNLQQNITATAGTLGGGGGGGGSNDINGAVGGNGYMLLYFSSQKKQISITPSYIEFPDGTQQTTASTAGASYWQLSNNTLNPIAGVTLVEAIAFNSTSDYRIKDNVKTLNENDTIDNLRPVKYTNKLTNKTDVGLIAHELQELFPFLVNGEKDGPNYQSVNYIGLIGLLIKEIQNLKARVLKLEELNKN